MNVGSAGVELRTEVRPGDIGSVTRLHGELYAREYGFDATFEAYVAAPLAEFVLRASPRERIWLAETDRQLAGCVAIVAESAETAQLRWFLVAPQARGSGLGRRLLTEALGFSRGQGYTGVVLWTVSALSRAADLYRAAGFRRIESRPARRWGAEVIEEKYELRFTSG